MGYMYVAAYGILVCDIPTCGVPVCGIPVCDIPVHYQHTSGIDWKLKVYVFQAKQPEAKLLPVYISDSCARVTSSHPPRLHVLHA